ncbi:MAG: methionyl-tRNA formyltransferase [Candidatus Omnitrophica bacterium]|nr:methionyl-tRNA formyltransferase [Candidatus Omnitrophota bacterium]
MKIVFIGAIEFSRSILKKLVAMKADIAGVVTRDHSDLNADFSDLSDICKQYNIPCRYAADINSKENIEWIKGLNPDILFNFGSSQVLKDEILNIAPMGVVGYHPAKLPENRGRHPIIWALVLGLKKTASTFFFMNKGVDSGDILDQVEVDILYEDDAKMLYEKLNATALRQVENFLPKLQNNDFKTIPQDQSKAGYWEKRSSGDGQIYFEMDSNAIYNLTRGLTRPYVGAHVLYKGREVKVWKAKEVKSGFEDCKPGIVLKSDENNIIVKCHDNAVAFEDHEFEELPKEKEYLL